MELSEAFLLKLFKFCAVGFSGLLVDFTVTWLLKEKLKIRKYYAHSSGFCLAASSNYILNRNWTFENNNPAVLSQYGKFFVVSLFGLLLSNLFIYFFHEKLKLNFYISKMIAIVIVFGWNFTINYIFTFSE
jgi:putative flippase GtrA